MYVIYYFVDGVHVISVMICPYMNCQSYKLRLTRCKLHVTVNDRLNYVNTVLTLSIRVYDVISHVWPFVYDLTIYIKETFLKIHLRTSGKNVNCYLFGTICIVIAGNRFKHTTAP